MHGIRILTIAVVAGLLGAPAFAQSSAPRRGFISLNGAYQIGTDDFSDSATFRENAEDGRFETSYTVEAGPAFDLSGGAMIARHVGVAAGVTRVARSTPTTIDASVPHPFFFSRPRSLSGDVGGLKREELGIHIQARGLVPIGSRMELSVFGGPSFFRVEQDLVERFDYREGYPYDTATLASATSSTAKKSGVGFNAGGDIAVFFTRQLGFGFGAQYSRATLAIASPAGGTVEAKVGGLQTGGGLRLRF